MRTIERIGIWRSWQPALGATVLAGVSIVAGFALLALGWRGAAAQGLVPLQVPYAVSGGLAGLALVGFGAALLNVQTTRRCAAREDVRAHEVAAHAVRCLERTAAIEDEPRGA